MRLNEEVMGLIDEAEVVIWRTGVSRWDEITVKATVNLGGLRSYVLISSKNYS